MGRLRLSDDEPVTMTAVEDTPKVETPKVWSQQQQDIFRWFEHGKGHLVVRARAGTGKTTTILEAVNKAPEEFILLCAFNTRIAEELKERLVDSKAMAATLHSIGFQALKKDARFRNARYDEKRGKTLTDAVCPPRVYDSHRRLITKLHTKARELMPMVTDPVDLYELALVNECVVENGPSLAEVCELAIKAMVLALEPTQSIDFADMIYLPVRLGLVKERFNMVAVDEAQDMSAPQLVIAKGVLRKGGRMVVVGDDRQAMYAFRGADSGALDRLKRELKAIEMGLTTTYRCGTEIVKAAQEIVPDIEAAGSHKGSVQQVSQFEMLRKVAPGDFVLSRTNAPLVRTIMSLLRDGRRAKIEGRDIGKLLLGLTRRLSEYERVTDIDVWLQNLDQWEAQEMSRALRAGSETRADMVIDQATTLRAIADGARDVGEVSSRIEHLFADAMDDRSFIIGSTVHKAKGLEADTVWMMKDTFMMPVSCQCGHRHSFGRAKCTRCACDRYVADPSKEREESNIRYVAITRAKQNLYFVEKD